MAGLRSGYELRDSQTLFTALLKTLAGTSPWSSWEICEGFLSKEIAAITKPIVYVYDPLIVNRIEQYGGCDQTLVMSLTIGCLSKGSYSEAEIMAGQVNKLLSSVSINSMKFNVILGLETTSSKTMIDHKIRITRVESPKWILSDVERAIFRVEQSFVFLTGG